MNGSYAKVKKMLQRLSLTPGETSARMVFIALVRNLGLKNLESLKGITLSRATLPPLSPFPASATAVALLKNSIKSTKQGFAVVDPEEP